MLGFGSGSGARSGTTGFARSSLANARDAASRVLRSIRTVSALAAYSAERIAAAASSPASRSRANARAAFSAASRVEVLISLFARRAPSRAEDTASFKASPVVIAAAAAISPARTAASTVRRDWSSFSSTRVTAKVSVSVRVAASPASASSSISFSDNVRPATCMASRRRASASSARETSSLASRVALTIIWACRGMASFRDCICVRRSRASPSRACLSWPSRSVRSRALSALA